MDLHMRCWWAEWKREAFLLINYTLILYCWKWRPQRHTAAQDLITELYFQSMVA